MEAVQQLTARIIIRADGQPVDVFYYANVDWDSILQDVLALVKLCKGCGNRKDYCCRVAAKAQLKTYEPKRICRLDATVALEDFILNLTEGNLQLTEQAGTAFQDCQTLAAARLLLIEQLKKEWIVPLSSVSLDELACEFKTPEGLLFRVQKVVEANPYENSHNKILEVSAARIVDACDEAYARLRQAFQRGFLTEEEFRERREQLVYSGIELGQNYHDERQVLRASDRFQYQEFIHFLRHRLGLCELSCITTQADLGHAYYPDGCVSYFSGIKGHEYLFENPPESGSLLHFSFSDTYCGKIVDVPVEFQVEGIKPYYPWNKTPHRYPWKTIRGRTYFPGYYGEAQLLLMPDDTGALQAKLLQKCYINYNDSIWQTAPREITVTALIVDSI